MVDQSITQLWKNMYSIFVPFLCKFSDKKWFMFELMCTMLCLFETLFCFTDHTSTNCFAQINICYIYSPGCEVILWHPCILKELLTFMSVYNTEYFATLNSDYFFTAFDLCICLPEESNFLILFFSACVLLFSESLKCACKGLVCWLHWVPFTAVSRAAYTVPL